MRKSFIEEYTVYAIRNEEEFNILKSEYTRTYEKIQRFILNNYIPNYGGTADCLAIRIGRINPNNIDMGWCELSYYKTEDSRLYPYKDYKFVEMSDILNKIKEEKERKQKMEEEGIKICAICGEVIGEDEDYLENRNGEYLCESCQNDGYLMCEDCGEFTDCPVSIDTDYKYVCEDCAYGNYYKCEDCGNYFTRSNVSRTYDDNYVCDDCRDDHYVTCDDCGRLVHEDNYYYNDRREAYYCPNCNDNHAYYDGCVEGYHAHKYNTIKFYQDNNDYTVDYDNYAGGYGFELEVDDGDNRGECSDELQDLLGDHAYYETDGSLSDDYGFEIITQPHTRLAMEQLPFREMVKILRKYNYKSHDCGNCGFHIHASRKLFGDTEAERTENIAKMILFYERYWDDIVKVSRRKSFGYCYKMSDGGYYGDEGNIDDERAKSIAKGEDDIARNRYKSINLTNKNTIEFRIMRGTLNLNTIKATLDFTMTLVENCKDIPMSEIGNKDLWLKGLKDETIEYLKTRRAFGYEPDDEENE